MVRNTNWLMVGTMAAGLLASSTATAQATVVLLDDISEPQGTSLHGKAADVGGPWDMSNSPHITINENGHVSTIGAARLGYVGFTQALAAGQVLVFDFVTEATPGSMFSAQGSQWAGFSLVEGDAERIFIGGLGNEGHDGWGVHAYGGSILSGTNKANHAVGQFTYAYDTGDWTLTIDGNLELAGPGVAGQALDGIRFSNGNGRDMAFSYVSVEFVPEPASVAILALGGCALLRRRRH